MSRKHRIQLQETIKNRDSSLSKDGVVVNGYAEKTQTEKLYTIKRPGIISEITGTGLGQGVYTYGDTVYSWDAGTTPTTPASSLITSITRRHVLSDTAIDSQYRLVEFSPRDNYFIVNDTFTWDTLPFNEGDFVDVGGANVSPQMTASSSNTFTYQLNKETTLTTSGTSTFSVSFTTGDTLPNKTWRSVTYGNGLWVVVSNTNVATSTDGKYWNLGVSLSSAKTKVVFGNNIFLAVGNSASYAYSSDGVTWTEGTVPSFSGSLTDLSFNGSYFVATGFNSSGYFSAKTTNGTSWTLGFLTGAGNFFSPYLNVWDGTYFIEAGTRTSVILNTLKTADGVNWSDAGITSTDTLVDFETIGATLVLSTNALKTYTSTNHASTWSSNVITNQVFNMVTTGTYILAKGDTNKILSTTDGISWSVLTSSAPFSGGQTVLGYNGSYFVAITPNASGSYISSDGITWI